MASKFMTMRKQGEVLEKVEELLNSLIVDHGKKWQVVGQEQAKNWEHNELLWEDDERTIPKMKDKYGYVDVPFEELEEEDKVLIEVCRTFIKKLDKLI